MEYEEIVDTDPYAAYDPAADPYQTEDLARTGEPGSFEFYDEGIDPSGEDELYFSDTELPGEYDYDEYEELYDGPILEGEEDMMYTDDWLPLPADAIPLESIPLDERPADYDTELYIGGLQYPDPGEVRDSYCELYPEACAEGQLGLNGREVYNGTEAAEEMSRTLKDVDFTGVCIAALLLLVLLFGLHYGGDSQTPAEAASRPRVESKEDERKKYDGFLKEAGYPDDEKRKKKLDEIMALPDQKERAKKADEAVTKFYDSELKKAGYKDDTDRGLKVKGILAQKTPEERTKKLEEYKKRMATAATDPAVGGPSAADIDRIKGKFVKEGVKDDDKDTEATRIAGLPREQQNAEIKKLRDAQKAAAGGGGGGGGASAAGGEPSAADIESVKRRLKAAHIKDDDNDTEAKRIAKLPTREEQDAEIKKLKEKKAADAKTDKDARDETERAGYEAQLKSYGYDDAKSKELSGEVMKEPREKRKEKMAELKKKGPKATGTTAASDPKATQAEKDEKERAVYEGRLKTYGYDDAKSKELSAEVMKEPKEKRKEKMEELKKNGPKATGATESGGGKGKGGTPSAAEALTDDAITKQLNAKGYTEPEVQKTRLAQIRAKGDPGAQQKELERILAKPEADIKKENDAARKKREAGAAPAGATVPPAADASTGASDGKTPSKTPKTAEELKARLKEMGYKDPVIEKMVKAWEDQKDEKKKASLLRAMINPDNKAKNEDRYKEGSAVVPPVAGVVDPPTGDDGKGKGTGKTPPTAEALKQYLKNMKYSDPAIEKMMQEYNATKSDEDKQKLFEKLKDKEKRRANENEYNPKAAPVTDGTTPPVVADTGTPDPNAGKTVKPSFNTADDFGKALKRRKYTGPAHQAMVKAWEDEKDPTKRAELEKKLLTKDPTQLAANETEYGKKANETPASDASKPKLAGMTEDDLRELLKSQGYNDKDAQDEIMDRLRAIPDEKGQKNALSKDYLRTPETVKRKNEQLGKERRARKEGKDPSRAGGDPAGVEVDVPTDEELHKRLTEAGWTDEKARKHAIDKIRGKEKPEDRLKEMKKHLAKDAAKNYMAPYAKAWDKKQKEGDDGKGKSIAAMTPEDEAKINKELEAAGITDPLARKNMINELKDKTEPKDRDAKYQGWLKRDKEKMKDLNKRRGDAQRKIEEGGATNPDGTPRKKGSKPVEEDGTTKPGYPYWILGFLLIPLLFVLAKRGQVTMPTGRYPLSMPSLPPMGGPWTTGSSWGPWGAREVEVTTGPKINRGLPELPRKKTTKSVSSPRLSPRSGSSAPSININNVNAQGENIPIDITPGSGGSDGAVYDTVIEETVVTEVIEEIPAVVTETVVVEETVVVPESITEEHIVIIEEEPVETFEFQGPSDPDRLMWMLISAGIISIPLLLDMTAGWPLRKSADIEYLSEAIHWLVLLSAAAAVYLKLDQTYHWSSRYGRRVPRYVTPVVVGAARGTENLVWSIDDAMFGGDQQMLGIAVVGGAFALMMMWNPFSNAETGEPTEGGGQMAGLAAMGMIAFLMANA